MNGDTIAYQHISIGRFIEIAVDAEEVVDTVTADQVVLPKASH
ncbi:MAG: hypothetical protein ABW077_05140 [Candidatus Thiodiazotropha endolucinida]